MKEQKSQHNQLGLANKQEAEEWEGMSGDSHSCSSLGQEVKLKVHCHEKLSSAFPGQHFLEKASEKGTSSTHVEAPSLGV